MADLPLKEQVNPEERDQHLAIRNRLWGQAHSMAGTALFHSDVFDEHIVSMTIRFKNQWRTRDLAGIRLELSHDSAFLTISAYDRILDWAVAYTKKDNRLRRYHKRMQNRLQRLHTNSDAAEPCGSQTAGDEALRQRFEELADWWRNETGALSSIDAIVRHPGYQRIIGMGEPALPLILADLKQTGDLWFAALYAITGENPVREEDRGNIGRMRDAWLQWGEQHGYDVC